MDRNYRLDLLCGRPTKRFAVGEKRNGREKMGVHVVGLVVRSICPLVAVVAGAVTCVLAIIAALARTSKNARDIRIIRADVRDIVNTLKATADSDPDE